MADPSVSDIVYQPAHVNNDRSAAGLVSHVVCSLLADIANALKMF